MLRNSLALADLSMLCRERASSSEQKTILSSFPLPVEMPSWNNALTLRFMNQYSERNEINSISVHAHNIL